MTNEHKLLGGNESSSA